MGSFHPFVREDPPAAISAEEGRPFTQPRLSCWMGRISMMPDKKSLAAELMVLMAQLGANPDATELCGQLLTLAAVGMDQP